MIKLMLTLATLMFVVGCKPSSSCETLAGGVIKNTYDEVAACANLMHGPMPTVEYSSFEHFGLPPAEGLYIPSTETVWINSDLGLSCNRQKAVLRHEFVHHLLRWNGYEQESASHDFPRVWDECGGIVGEP